MRFGAANPSALRVLLPLVAAASVAIGCSDERVPDGEEDPLGSFGGREYYVRPNGNDANSGTSEAEAWRSIERVNAQDFEPSDAVLFEGGATFKGTLKLDAADSGTRSRKLFVSSFGEKLAVIEAGSGDGISITDASHVAIHRFVVRGGWNAGTQSGNDGEGIRITGTARGEQRRGIEILGVEVSGFKHAGIGLHARPPDDVKNSGYQTVDIRESVVHDNGDFGVISDGPYIYDGPGYSHSDVHVYGVRAYNNRGLKNKGEHTGSGIMLSDVESAVIMRSVAHHNGEFNDHEDGGGFGIWAWDSDGVVIELCESYGNRTGTSDGGGFALDGGVTRSVMKYNYSHDNQGAGYGAFQFGFARPYSDNLIEYNITQNDGFSFLVWDGNGDMGSLAVVNNVGYGPKPVLATLSALKDASFVNNVFYGIGPKLFDVFDGSALTLQGNAYWSGDAALSIAWNTGTAAPVTYDSFDAYRAGTGLETRGGNVTGVYADPKLVAAGSGPTLDDAFMLHTLTMYGLTDDSPLIDRGLEPAEFDVTAAADDFFRRDAPRGEARDIGVYEAR